jgi:tetratricopeptide (TPR) repeat protein
VVLAHVERDTFEDYLEAQNKLIALVEGAPSNLEVRAVLCLVYKELWPFATQDAIDQKVISGFTQTTRVLDVTSPFGSLCESVKLMTSGRYREARGSIENLLEMFDSFSMRPVVYSMKAELLENDKDYQIAGPYYAKASQDWQRWVKPRLRLGFIALQLREYPKGAEYFRGILASNPDHKVAKIGLGFAEYFGFRQSANAIKYLSSALSSNGRIPRLLESEAWQVYSELLIDRGDKRDALNAAQTSYKLNPNNDIARQLVLRLGGSDRLNKGDNSQNNELIFLGDQYVRQGDCLSAQAEFKAAFELDPKNGTAAMKAAKCLWTLNQSYEAIEWLNRAIRADSKLVSAYVLQSDYLSQRYDFNGATQALTNATRAAPNNNEVLRGMALLELRKNNTAAAINYGLRAMKLYDADIDTYIILSKANLSMAMGIQSSAKKEQERKETAYRDAIRYATKAIEFDATNSEAQITYARMLAVTNGTDSAAEHLRNLIKKYAYSFEYRLALAEIYKESERWTDSRMIYEQVVETDSRNKKAWIGLGESLRATGFNDNALKAFLNAAVIDPTDGEALFQAGKLYYESNRFEEALQQFVRVKGMNANFPRANFYAGRSAFALGRFEEALRFAREEKKNNPNLADAYLLMGEVQSAQGAFAECAMEYSQAIRLRPGSAEIYVKAAQCYRQTGSLEIAETMLTLAKERESGYPDLYKELGALFEKKGDPAAARQSYRNYLELSPNAPDRKEIEQRVARLGG